VPPLSHASRRSRRLSVVLTLEVFALFMAVQAGAQETPAVPNEPSGKVIVSPTATAPPAQVETAVVAPSLDCALCREAQPKRSPFGVSLGIGGGVAYFTETSPFGTDTSIGRALSLGYTLSLRASIEFLSWLALDVRGRVLHNDGNDFVKNGAITTWGGLGAVRLTLPLPRIRPYVLVGAGGYSINASGNGTLLVNDTVAAVEFGLGAIVDAGRGVEVGLEYTYSHLLGETLSTNPNADGGDPSSLSLFAQYRFNL
jgi:opacity protein-like surface antigen